MLFPGQKFELGSILLTPGAVDALKQSAFTEVDEFFELLQRHATGDWGNVDAEDAKENNFSVENGYRILSSYQTRSNEKLWIITEADRGSTTALLPSEY